MDGAGRAGVRGAVARGAEAFPVAFVDERAGSFAADFLDESLAFAAGFLDERLEVAGFEAAAHFAFEFTAREGSDDDFFGNAEGLLGAGVDSAGCFTFVFFFG